MSGQNTPPRWSRLYPVLPLAAVLFWFSDRVHTSGLVHGSLALGALLIAFIYVQVWLYANRAALLQHPVEGDIRRLYRAREALPRRATGKFYSDLFAGESGGPAWPRSAHEETGAKAAGAGRDGG